MNKKDLKNERTITGGDSLVYNWKIKHVEDGVEFTQRGKGRFDMANCAFGYGRIRMKSNGFIILDIPTSAIMEFE